jgi:hypothetical protein
METQIKECYGYGRDNGGCANCAESRAHPVMCHETEQQMNSWCCPLSEVMMTLVPEKPLAAMTSLCCPLSEVRMTLGPEKPLTLKTESCQQAQPSCI